MVFDCINFKRIIFLSPFEKFMRDANNTRVYKFLIIFSEKEKKRRKHFFNICIFWDADFESTARKIPSDRIFKI